MAYDGLLQRKAVIVHFHARKTGGTLLAEIMRHAFAQRVHVQREPDDPPPSMEADEFDYLSGHWAPARYLPLFPPDRCFRFIILRHPLLLLCSQYAQLFRQPRSDFAV